MTVEHNIQEETGLFLNTQFTALSTCKQQQSLLSQSQQVRSFLGLVVLLFSAGEELLDDADTQSVTESDSAEGKEQHDTCVRGQFLSKWKWKLSKWL